MGLSGNPMAQEFPGFSMEAGQGSDMLILFPSAVPLHEGRHGNAMNQNRKRNVNGCDLCFPDHVLCTCGDPVPCMLFGQVAHRSP